MDDRLYPLLNLAVFIEYTNPPATTNSFIYGNGSDGHKVMRQLLSSALDHCEFRKLLDGDLGTHSIRKGAATYGAKCGVSKDHIELRGRWRGPRKQVDTYIDVERAFPDALVATRLCGPNGASRCALSMVDWCTPVFRVEDMCKAIFKQCG
ncbi:hypothetical protein AC1031_004488 [Aphanomyces cochlioides]|nr:hypothetical protein AC1031_004488 [Aphanomyces cochlioides]